MAAPSAPVANGLGAAGERAEAAAMDVESESSTRAIGIIQPPPDIKNIVDKTAAFVAKNGPQFEQRILTNEKNTTKFGFLQPHSPYYPYYQKKLQESRASSGAPAQAPAAAPPPTDEKAEVKEEQKTEAVAEGKKDVSATIEAKASVDTLKKRRPLKQPSSDVYTVAPPEGLSIPTLDLDIIKLTAQYVALNGRSFLNGLLTRENRNPQFDFLKGHHYLFGYFTALVEAYSKIFNPPEGIMEKVKKDADDRVDILERAFQRLDWEAHLEKERQMTEANAARERETAAMIDWHDFKVVETIDFADDDDEDLPPPLTESELRALRMKASTVLPPMLPTAGKEAPKPDEGAADMEMDDGGGDMEMEEDDEPAEQESAQVLPHFAKKLVRPKQERVVNSVTIMTD